MDTNQAVTLPSPHPGLTPAPSAPSVVSVGSSPFHGAPVSATQLCEVPDGEPAPVTPEWMLHAPLQPAEAGPADDACPVCLCVVLPCLVGPEARYEWPSCGLVAPWLRGAPVCELTCHVVSGLPVRVVSVCTGHFHAAMS